MHFSNYEGREKEREQEQVEIEEDDELPDDVVELEGELFTDREAEEGEDDEYAYPPADTETLDELRSSSLEDDEAIPDPSAREWRRVTEPIYVEGRREVNVPRGHRLCKNNCGRLVPQSRNPGRERLFCSHSCANRYHSRSYYHRRRSASGWALKVSDHGVQTQVLRQKPSSSKLAERIYYAHIERGTASDHNCPAATEETGWRCPAALSDPHSEKKLCLTYATIVDDMKERWGRDRGELYLRQWTTNDGRWLEGSELDPHIDRDRGEYPPDWIQPISGAS